MFNRNLSTLIARPNAFQQARPIGLFYTLWHKKLPPKKWSISLSYNTDMRVEASEFAADPAFEHLVRPLPLLAEFEKEDERAKTNKRYFQVFGLISLSLGAIALIGIILELYLLASGHTADPMKIFLIEMAAIASISIALVSRLAGFRSKYRGACFRRERIRQWRFQVFLDGSLVEMFQVNPEAAKIEFNRRWNAFLNTIRVAGADIAFLRTRSESLSHSIVSYTDSEIFEKATSFLKAKRLDYQASYTGHRLDDDPEKRASLPLQFQWSEALARTSLLAALLLPACHIFYTWSDNSSGAAHAAYASTALVLVVISLVSRTYRAGMTLPGEIESYRAYLRAIDALRVEFDSARSDDVKLDIFERLEIEAEEELRRFIEMKKNATFVL